MLENIKSSYFSKMIFSWIDEKRKLNTIKYNKNLQEKMNITLLNYKIFYGKYIIFEDKGKGKEYDSNGHLKFEGEYLNGKRNGKGKEYDYKDGKSYLIFEGKYLNGQRNGIGKIYYREHLLFIGEFKNGKLNGEVKEYYIDGNLKFEGEYLNGKRNGKGKEYNDNGKLIFEGEYLRGSRWEGDEYNFIVEKIAEYRYGRERKLKPDVNCSII